VSGVGQAHPELGWYSEEEPGTVSFLRAGPLDLTLEGADLRWIGIGRDELVRRVGVAVRDESWGTIPPEISEVSLERHQRSFTLRFRASHRSAGLHFDWDGEVSGEDDGTIRYSLDGVCCSDFRYNRIGLIVLHPLTLAGARYTARNGDAEVQGELPRTIGPQRIESGTIHPLFPSFDSLVLDGPTGRLSLEFEGDLYETEDQRNWTDGSFKTYSTPLNLGWPHEAVAGQRIAQRLNVRFDPVQGRTVRVRRAIARGVEVTLGRDTGRPLPTIGLGLSSDGEELGLDAERVRSTRPAHVRVDLDGASASWPDQLARAKREADSLGARLEAAVLCDDDLALIDELGLLPPGFLRRVIVLTAGGLLPDSKDLDRVRERLPDGIEVSAGTDGHFADLNRASHPPSGADSLCYPISPQAHASDNASIVETLEAQADTVKTAGLHGLPVVVSPVTLRPRVALRAAGGVPRTPIDARQHSSFCAAWTVASIKRLSEAGATSLTYFETVGPRGVVPRSGRDAPVASALTELAALRHATVVASYSDAPLAIQTLALSFEKGIVLFVMNLSRAPRQAVVGSPGQLVELAPYEIRRLELASAETATETGGT
jgi:hypothetical protein